MQLPIQPPAEPLRFACTSPATPEEEEVARAYLHELCREWYFELEGATCELTPPAKTGAQWVLTLTVAKHTWIFRRPHRPRPGRMPHAGGRRLCARRRFLNL